MGSPEAKAEGRREEILASIDDLPAFPPIAARIIELMNDPDSSAADLARAISRDQSLTAKILRAGNSSFYGFAQQVTSLPQAVVVLGLRTVRDVVLLDSLPMRGQKGGLTPIQKKLWMHSVSAALCSRFLALRQGGVDADTAFMCGLFHDSGQLLMQQFLKEEYEATWNEAETSGNYCELEQSHFGVDHTEIGEEAFRRWELPGPIAEVCRRHHDEPSTLDPLSCIVRASDDFVHWLERHPEAGRDTDDGALETESSDQLWGMAAPETATEDDRPNQPGSAAARLGLNDVELDDLAARLRAAVEREARFFLSGS